MDAIEIALDTIRRKQPTCRIRMIPLLPDAALKATDALEADGVIYRTGRRRGCCCYLVEDLDPITRHHFERVAAARRLIDHRGEIGMDLKSGDWIASADTVNLLVEAGMKLKAAADSADTISRGDNHETQRPPDRLQPPGLDLAQP